MTSLTARIAFAPDSADKAWLPGFMHAIAAFAVAPVLGIAPCVAGLAMASVVSFVVYLPLTMLVLNGGEAIAEDADAPALTPVAQIALWVLWTATAWATAATVAVVR